MKTKVLYVLLVSSILSSSQLNAQTQIKFYGFTLGKYAQPIEVSKGKYQGYYKHSRSSDYGRIVLDKIKKTFTIKWSDGTDWIAKYSKIETSKTNELNHGDVMNTIYSGKWINVASSECLLLVKKTKNMGCIIILKAGTVNDENYNLHTWQNILQFRTTGGCFD